jgi:hypothetical protein
MGAMLMYSDHGSDKKFSTAVSRVWNYRNERRWQIFHYAILNGEIVRGINMWNLLYFNHYEKASMKHDPNLIYGKLDVPNLTFAQKCLQNFGTYTLLSGLLKLKYDEGCCCKYYI